MMPVRFHKSLFAPAAAALLALGLFACDGKQDAAQAEPAATEEPTAAMEAGAPNPVNQVTVTGDDQMKFSTQAITVKAGEEVTLVLENVGQLPKQAMGHNLIVLKEGAAVEEYAQKAMSAQQNEYIPESESEQVIAHTKLLGPGEADTISFTLPAPGAYPYLCSFPAHYVTMRGVITAVE